MSIGLHNSNISTSFVAENFGGGMRVCAWCVCVCVSLRVCVCVCVCAHVCERAFHLLLCIYWVWFCSVA